MSNNLGAADVCAIIKACGEARVAILQFGELSLWMDGPVVREHLNPAPRTVSPQLPEAEISETQKIESELALVQAELAMRADDSAELILTDPAKYEELLLKGDLEEDEEPGTEEA